ncbi:MAG TPA: radical SAM family heme chaperone HemW [Saprospiraceae bacterium]|nr:radical SAM family heme chaperone HemW [Saprospiraceae bacterium]
MTNSPRKYRKPVFCPFTGMAGLYIHIPFCKQACTYCNFHFSTNLKYTDELVTALHRELAQRKTFLPGRRISTIYFGGGTPSLLRAGQIKSLISDIQAWYEVDPEPEVTLEANPDDLNPLYLHQVREAGINRLSIGVQSFFDEDLKFMRRAHHSRQALDSIRMSREAGFENITIDLIYGIPGSSMDQWRQNLFQAFELEVPHLSCYALTVEPRTILSDWIKKGKAAVPEEEETIRQFEFLMEEAERRGWRHYEISNFAKAGFESRHNSSYWEGTEYLGIGPSAHSYREGERQWNVANNHLYLKALAEGLPHYESEQLSRENIYNEYILTRIRTAAGLDLFSVPESFRAHLVRCADKHLQQGHLEQEGNFYRLTRKGKFIADRVTVDLFL